MKTYYSVYSSKTASGQVSKKNIPINEEVKLVHGGMIKVLPNILKKKIKVKLTTKGIEIEKKDLKKLKEKLMEDFQDSNKVKKYLKEMKKNLKKMDEAISKKNGKLNYENSQKFFGYFFWSAPYYNFSVRKIKKKVKEFLPNLSKEERNEIFLKLITMDVESYTFKIVEDFGKKNVFKKHPFLKHLKGAKIKNLPKIKIKNKRNQRKEALKKIKKLVNNQQFKEIKEWSDLINELQIILEIKNYYWPKLIELLEE